MDIMTKSWAQTRINEDEIEKYLTRGKSFIDEERMDAALCFTKIPDKRIILDILQKSLDVETLTLEETALLMRVTDSYLLEKMKETALAVKKKVYDNRIVTFAPLYLSNACVNDCVYCGFRCSNIKTQRKTLTLDEVTEETKVLAGQIGHKRLIVVYGEHPDNDVHYMADTIRTIYDVRVKARVGYGQIRRVNVNAAPLCVDDLKILGHAGIGTYQVFQETYHHPTYQSLHPKNTIKANYLWRLYAMHRALEAGIDDVGIGALFGLYDWRYEVLGLVAHNIELEKKFGIGAHTISFPRLEPAENVPFTHQSKHKVSDEEFKKIMMVLRLAVPHAGMIITSRETPELKRASIELGITQTDASTKIGLGAYSDGSMTQEGRRQQFMLGDTRSLDEVIQEFTRLGHITSFCTAGYRCNRTGKCIMDLLRSGKEGKFCKLNAVLTFREWVDDFGSAKTQELAKGLLEKEINEIRNTAPNSYPHFMRYYERISRGERDLYF
ncbi:MAG: [FeFe] hydrogenase H-cluster radical SAM maturase HydG [Candidatus Omnitrophica bacterium]|nr:[FeFe] hydrogenase H-cluster radical SAM maturase HydG [Candidatus Omnitrophota bacterium]